MSDPVWRGGSDGFGGNQPKSQWTQLQEDLASKFINQIASAPSPSDRLAEQRRQAGAQAPVPFDNVAQPTAQPYQGTRFGAFDGTNGIRSFDDLSKQITGGQPVGNSHIGIPMPQIRPRQDVPVLHGDPNRPAPEYPGGIGPDARIIGRTMDAAGPGPRVMWELFTKTYNSRSKENVLPSNLPLVEVAPQAQAKIDHWMLMGDSDLNQPRAEYNNRNLRPGPDKEPGHIFAVGVNKEGNPINVVEYYWGDKSVVYAGQYQIAYSRDNQGLMHSRIDHYNADQSSIPGPRAVIGQSRNVYEGTTEYISNNQNQVISMRKYDYINPGVAKVGIDFDQAGAHKVWRDSNSGRLVEQAINPVQVKQTVNSLAPQFYFRNLFGP
jgi:hypothetical protein